MSLARSPPLRPERYSTQQLCINVMTLFTDVTDVLGVSHWLWRISLRRYFTLCLPLILDFRTLIMNHFNAHYKVVLPLFVLCWFKKRKSQAYFYTETFLKFPVPVFALDNVCIRTFPHPLSQHSTKIFHIKLIQPVSTIICPLTFLFILFGRTGHCTLVTCCCSTFYEVAALVKDLSITGNLTTGRRLTEFCCSPQNSQYKT